MANDIIKEKVIIDLTQPGEQRSLVPVSKSLFVDFPPRDTKTLWNKLMSKFNMRKSIKNVKIGFRDLKYDGNLLLKAGVEDAHSLFSLIFGTDQYDPSHDLIDITLTQERTAFQLYFMPEKVADCKVVQGAASANIDEVYPVSGTIYITNSDGEELDSQDFIIGVSFRELHAEVRTKIVLYKSRLKYSDINSNRVVPAGELQITNPKPFSRSPKIDFEGQLNITYTDGRELPPLVDDAGKRLSRIYFDDSKSPLIKITELRSPRTSIDGIETFNPYRRKFSIDMTGIPNPLNEFDEFVVSVEGSWWYSADKSNRPSPVKSLNSIRLNKDNQGTELRVALAGEDLTTETYRKLDALEFIPGGAFLDRVNLLLSNIATDSSRGGALRIFRPLIKNSISESNKNVFGARGRATDIDNVVTLQGDLLHHFEEENFLDIPNAENADRILTLQYNPTDIYSIGNGDIYDINLDTTIEISYQENTDGTDWNSVPRKTFRLFLSRPLHILPFPQWLCVDYGSSAIVSLYDNRILDLNRRRKDIFSKLNAEWQITAKSSKNDPESGTPFIASDLLLNLVTGIDAENPVSQLCGEQSDQEVDYGIDAVALAPAPKIVTSNFRRILPCLKLLVGNKYLPDNPDYERFEYYRRNDDIIQKVVLKDTKDNEERSSLALINNLFDEAYKIVFRHYLSKLIPNIERVNRLVLTYPNSYTPEHLKVLRAIAKDTFRYLRDGQPKFVSESDAVAAYYMDHWKEYNDTGDFKSDENVLVYDMGAGTLDLTYLSKTYDKLTDTVNVEIKGKLGISKAGNYLDFVLAEIVAEKGGELYRDLPETKRPTSPDADAIIKGRIELKNFVKSVLKPKLCENNRNEEIEFISNSETLFPKVRIKIGDVLEHKKFKQYVRQVTSLILTNIKRYVGGSMPLDTVIFSGRSVRLEPLRTALEKAVEAVVVRKSGIKMINLALNGDNDRQKTAVVEGAVKYVSSYLAPDSRVKISSRRLYASYGVTFKSFGGETRYVQLAAHTEMPLTSDHGTKVFDPKIIKGLANTESVTLIQSFLPEVETLDAIKKNKFDYISVMNNFDISKFGSSDTLDLSIEIDYNNLISLVVNGQPTVGTTPKGVDLNDNITRASIWPATI